MAVKYCRTCALRDPDRNICRRFSIGVKPTEDYCSWWASQILVCARCGQLMLPTGSVVENGQVYCGGCARTLGD